MKEYRLPYTMSMPTEDSGGMYVAEVPILPGCMAWGETEAEALRILEGVAADFIQSYKEHNDPLPMELRIAGELTVTV